MVGFRSPSPCAERGSGVRTKERGNLMPGLNGRRVAVVAGVRTPFTKAGTALKDARAVDLARYAARELLERTNLDGTEVDEVIFGQVVPSALVPNVGREVSLLPQLPKEIPAYSDLSCSSVPIWTGPRSTKSSSARSCPRRWCPMSAAK